MKEIQDFDSVMIKLASPEQIRAWSYGEVKKPETINYRTLRPEREGLFCEKIFGTTKEWECYCGKFKSIRYKGVICDRCGVEVTNVKVRRERMGHINLASPVSHIWYYRSVPSRIGYLLDLGRNALQSVLYYEKYIVINPGEENRGKLIEIGPDKTIELKQMQLLTEEEYIRLREKIGDTFTAGMGAEAIRTLLAGLDLQAISEDLRRKMREKGDKADKKLLKRIEVVDNFLASENRPEWMILTVIPVIPPDLRPMVQLDGGRFATSDLNDLYRRVINRNNRLQRLINLHAPDIIVRNEKRMLQEAVDALFDNSKRKRGAVKGANSRPLKSLSDMLKGKQGRFRQNLLGKRVDYSGRSVIVVGPELRIHQCGLPSKMALELYKPFLMKKLVHNGVASNVKKAKTIVEQESPEVWAVLDEVVKEHPVMLNRAPTLHRLGIQAFEPVLVDGKAIKLHPLVCRAFNADFDGDQMAVHVPLTQAAQLECWTLMLSATNLLDPANGKPIVYPSQDMVLGINYLTRAKDKDKGEGRYYDNIDEIQMAIENNVLSYNAKIGYTLPSGKRYTFPRDPEDYTTAGRLLFADALPKVNGISFEKDMNKCFGDKGLKKLIEQALKNDSNSVVCKLADAIKDVGYKYATVFGATIGLSDMIIPETKKEIIEAANRKQAEVLDQYHHGQISQEERYNTLISTWSQANEDLADRLMEDMKKSQNGFNPLFLMADSGARGSKTQIRQLGGMRGLMAKPNGDIIEFPIKSNFKEGLSIIEFFISTNGARKGLSDTALKTAEAGYLTRRLVDISQDVVVNEEDCGTINGIERTAIKDGDDIVASLSERITGHYTLENVLDPKTGEVIVPIDHEITDDEAKAIEAAGVEKVLVRYVLTCEAKHGVCRKCYGRNLATNRPVAVGEAVGIIAAQSIGQPGTQLTMRTFHVGGTASTSAEANKIIFKHGIKVESVEGNIVTREADDQTGLPEARIFTRKGNLFYRSFIDENGETLGPVEKLTVRAGSELLVEPGTLVPASTPIIEFDPFSEPIISESDGIITFQDLVLGTTLIKEVNEETGTIGFRVTDHVIESAEPALQIIGEDGTVCKDDKGKEITYLLPGSSYILVQDGEMVKKGHVIAKLLTAGAKTKDITGGLPRVGELFEARKPKNMAVLAAASGEVEFGKITKGKREIDVIDDFGRVHKHMILLGKHILVRDGDHVEAGERLCDGNINPHDILAISGENKLQEFLLNEVQEVYRLQGVDINDKHLGIVVRQMLRKVEITRVGDTRFIQGQKVDKFRFHEENNRVMAEGGQAAVARPCLLGITHASLSIDSFVSAASFQETTRVLTTAAIAGSKDELRGLKENVIIGHLIPAGTGMKCYRDVKLADESLLKVKLAEEKISANAAAEEFKEDFEKIADMSYEDDSFDDSSDLSMDEDE